MPNYCIVWKCENTGVHKMPKDDTLRRQWIDALKLDIHKKVGRTLTRNSHVCSSHFKPTDLICTNWPDSSGVHNKRYLKKNAVPTIFDCTGEPCCNNPLHNKENDDGDFRVNFRPSAGLKTYSREDTPGQDNPFSWQTVTKEVVDEDNAAEDAGTFCDDSAADDEPETCCDEAQMVPDPCVASCTLQEVYSCNVCQQRITGFRYVCVMCPDWDLCGACEAREQHSEHYVLRVPPGKPHSVTAAVLATLRQMLAAPEQPDVTLVKQEVKIEDPLAGMESPCGLQGQDTDVREIRTDMVTVSIEHDTATDTKRSNTIHKLRPAPRKRNLASASIGDTTVHRNFTTAHNPPRKRKIVPLPLTAVYSKKPENTKNNSPSSSNSAIAYQKKKTPIPSTSEPSNAYRLTTTLENIAVTSLDDGISNVVETPDRVKTEHEPSTSEPSNAYRLTTTLENIAVTSLDGGISNIAQLSDSVKIEHEATSQTENSEVILDDHIRKVQPSDRDEIEHLIAWSHKHVKEKPLAFHNQIVALEDMGSLGDLGGATETNSDDEIRTASFERRSKQTRRRKATNSLSKLGKTISRSSTQP